VANTVRILYSNTSGNVPASLVNGQLGLNQADGKLFYRSAAGVVTALPTGSTSVVEYDTPSGFPATGTTAVVYIARDTGKMYHWIGTAYAEIGTSSGISYWDYFLPFAPTGVSAAPGNSRAIVSWTAPSSLTQTPITDYTVQYSSNNGSTWATFSRSASTATSATVTGLTNGTAYLFRVAAVNGIGTGAYSSASSSLTVNGDTYFNSVSTLLHFDGANNATTFTDTSSTPKAFTAYGNAKISTAQAKFGASSLYLDGSNSYISCASSSDFGMGTGDFTFEGWFYPTANIDTFGNLMNFGTYATGVLLRIAGASTGGDFLYLANTQLMSSSRLTTTSIPTNAWTHVALVRSSGTVYVFINGTILAQQSGVTSNLGTTQPMTIGKDAHIASGTNSDVFVGYIDEIRVTRVARYAAPFTPSAIAFQDS
jgi:hypothetical protein